MTVISRKKPRVYGCDSKACSYQGVWSSADWRHWTSLDELGEVAPKIQYCSDKCLTDSHGIKALKNMIPDLS